MTKFSETKIKKLKKLFLEIIEKNHGFVYLSLKECGISTTMYYL